MKRIIIFYLCVSALVLIAGCRTDRKDPLSMTQKVFGVLPDGRQVFQYTLQNSSGAIVRIINYGAVVTELRVPDRNGTIEDVVLGYDSLQKYIDDTGHFGAIVGRYGNRIGKGRFELDGVQYQLATNNGENHLHGGPRGFDKVLWDAQLVEKAAGPSLELQYVSPDGEEGYPGTVTLKVAYTLTEENELRIDYEGTTDKPTLLNPTHHSYFNLSGSFTETILDHLLIIEADSMTPVDSGLIPTGEIASVEDTPMDFRSPAVIGARINDASEQLEFGKGYDHNFVLRGSAGSVRKAAELYDPSSGRLMTVFTDQAGLQFYSGNFLNGTAEGKGGISYGHRTGLCLEAQAFPDSPNKPHFPSVTLRPGQVYRQTTIYKFSTR